MINSYTKLFYLKNSSLQLKKRENIDFSLFYCIISPSLKIWNKVEILNSLDLFLYYPVI
jgi:hypothetical protein